MATRAKPRRASGCIVDAAAQKRMASEFQVIPLLSEQNVAQVIGRNLVEVVRYDREAKRWYFWVGTHWSHKAGNLALQAIYESCCIAAGFLAGGQLPVQKREKALKVGFSHAVETAMRTQEQISMLSAAWDANPWLLGTPDGTVDLRTGKTRGADPADYISRLTTVSPAKPGTKAPRWRAFLDQVTRGNKDVEAFLQVWFGTGAIGSSRDQKLVFIHGPGGNGKSALLNIIAKLLGPYHTSIDADLLVARSKGSAQHPAGLAKVLPARTASASEVPPGARWNTAVIKALTGGEDISARFMHQNFTDSPARCTVTVGANERPALAYVDLAIRRRMLLVPFLFVVADPVPDFDLKLIEAEGPAILRWIIDGAIAREKAGKLVVPQCIKDASGEYFIEEDLIGRFVEERCEIDARPLIEQEEDPWKISSTDLYEAWKSFSIGLDRMPVSHTVLSPRIESLAGVTKVHTNKGKVFQGLRLNGANFYK